MSGLSKRALEASFENVTRTNAELGLSLVAAYGDIFRLLKALEASTDFIRQGIHKSHGEGSINYELVKAHTAIIAQTHKDMVERKLEHPT